MWKRGIIARASAPEGVEAIVPPTVWITEHGDKGFHIGELLEKTKQI
jgi:hypothetical protein